MKPLKLLGISGSLRKHSHNTAALAALKALSKIDITIADISDLPLFNPDREHEEIPALNDFKLLLKESDGLIIASPEYAHGISGPLKNALDWLVSGDEFPYQAIMLINTSPRATHAQLALREVLTTMSGHIIEDASVSIPLLSSHLDAKGIAEDEELSVALECKLKVFVDKIHATDLT